jgi:hypothetical protein
MIIKARLVVPFLFLSMLVAMMVPAVGWVVTTPRSAQAAHVSCGDQIMVDTTLDSDLVCVGPGLTIGADNVPWT